MKGLKYAVVAVALLQASSTFAASVQAGAFSVPSNASRMVQRLESMGYQAVSVSRDGLNVVRIENLSSTRANNTCDRLESSGIECFVAGGGYAVSNTKRYAPKPAAPRNINTTAEALYPEHSAIPASIGSGFGL